MTSSFSEEPDFARSWADIPAATTLRSAYRQARPAFQFLSFEGNFESLGISSIRAAIMLELRPESRSVRCKSR